jgi:hypothetical protein
LSALVGQQSIVPHVSVRADGHVDGETDLAKVIVAFRKFCESAKMGGGGVGNSLGGSIYVHKNQTNLELNNIMTTGLSQ